MSTSGSYSYTMTVEEIIEHAFSLCGDLSPNGLTNLQRRDGKRILNLVQQRLESEGIRTWKRDRTTTLYDTGTGVAQSTLTSGTAAYDLGTDTMDIDAHSVVYRDSNGYDTKLVPMSVKEYQLETDKDASGVPTRFLIERNVDITDSTTGRTLPGRMRMTLHPVPNTSSASIVYVRTQRIADANSAGDNIDVERRWLNAVVYGTAYERAMMLGLPANQRSELRANFEVELSRMRTTDVENGTLFFVPVLPRVGRL